MDSDIEEQRGNNVGGITGKGFMPGQSGNPGGRPRGSKSLRSLLVEALRKKAKDGKGGEKEFYELLTESIVVNAAKGNAALVKLIFDYLEGPPPQRHELTGKDGGAIEQTLTVDAQVLEIAAVLKESLAGMSLADLTELADRGKGKTEERV